MPRLVCDSCQRTEDEAHQTGLYCCYNCAWSNPAYATRPVPSPPMNWIGFFIFVVIVLVLAVAMMI